MRALSILFFALSIASAAGAAQGHSVRGMVRDDGGGPLPGVVVTLSAAADERGIETTTDAAGTFEFANVRPGAYRLTYTLINFATTRRAVTIGDAAASLDVIMHFAVNADVTVTGRRTFTNLADVEHPEEDLVGIAQSSSQGAVTAAQIETRPIMREGEVLETVPGVIVTQHSGEGKANQYFLRGFNLDHGTDFATTVAGVPANMPTHAHGQGYTDLNFLIPELVSGVQFSKGPYYADQGDFATAGAATIAYATALDQPIAGAEAGGEGFGRILLAASPRLGKGRILTALEIKTNDGPWVHPDDFRSLNGVVRYSQGDAVNGLAITGLAYGARWNATDQIPDRAIAAGLDRFDSIDPTDGGRTERYSGSIDWQRGGNRSLLKISAFGLGYGLDLYSNFTYYLDDPLHGDQIHQKDRRFVAGARATYRRIHRWNTVDLQNTYGFQIRNDDITAVALEHTRARAHLDTVSDDGVVETGTGFFAQNETVWRPWLRTLAGLRADLSHASVDASDPVNSGVSHAGIVSPKGGVTVGPWRGTEIYVNAGSGFHSNDARGTTLTRDADGTAVQPVSPLVRAVGVEAGVRTIAMRHLQSTLTVWTLHLDSELVFAADEGTTEPSGASRRHGVEWANYYRPLRPLVFDADLSWSSARFVDPPGGNVPEAVGTVISAGATLDASRRLSGSLRWRYFGPRALVEDGSVRSQPTSLLNLQAVWHLSKRTRVTADVFNLTNAPDSDIDYFYTSRLPGEPLSGVADIHTHPTIPRTLRVALAFGL
jgi:hypothetical protein